MQDESQIEAVYKAVNSKDLDKLKALVAQGVSVDVRNDRGIPILRSLFNSTEYAKHEELLNYLIEHGADVTYVDDDESLLFGAVSFGLISTAKALLEHGVDKNKRDEKGRTPLFNASTVEMLEFLVANKVGAYSDRANNGDTLLHRAVGFHPNMEMISHLLQHIDANNRNNEGETALHTALLLDYYPEKVEEAVRFLISKGADINLRGISGTTPLMLAVRSSKRSLDFIKYIVQAGADVNAKDDNSSTVLHFSAANNLTYVKYFTESGANINAVNAHNQTPLYLAVRFQKEAIVDYFLTQGANPNIKSSSGKTALNIAKVRDFSDIVSLLETRGAIETPEEEIRKIANEEASKKAEGVSKIDSLSSAINAKDMHEFKRFYAQEMTQSEFSMHDTALDVLHDGTLEMLKFLVDEGLDLTLQDGGFTLLHEAVIYNQLEMVRYLVERGLDINAEVNGHSVFSLAAGASLEMIALVTELGAKTAPYKEESMVNLALRFQKPEIAKYFETQGFEFEKGMLQENKYIFTLVRRQDTATIQYLIDKGLDIETTLPIYGDDATLLHFSVLIKADKMVNFLLKAGANPNARNSENKPIFTDVINLETEGIVEPFFQYADLEVKARDQTSLLLALKLRRIEIVRYLIERGADVNAENDDKNTPVHLAAKEGYLDALKKMEVKGGNLRSLNKEGKTPLDLARENDRKAVSAYLEKAASDNL